MRSNNYQVALVISRAENKNNNTKMKANYYNAKNLCSTVLDANIVSNVFSIFNYTIYSTVVEFMSVALEHVNILE